MKHSTKTALTLAVAGCAFDACAAHAAERDGAAAYPSRPLRMVVGLPAGGSTDVVARIVASGLADTLGQHVIVDNRLGRSGIVAGERVAKQSIADGYTMYFGASFFSEMLALVEGTLPYDPLQDLKSVALITKIPNVLVASPALPVKSVGDLAAYAKARTKPLSYASSGSGSSAHLSMEMLKQRLQIDAIHIPYKGAPQALVDLFSGQVGLMFGNIPAQLPHIKSGKLRALGVSSSERSLQLPDVPTLSESGVPGYEITVWYGIVVPARTPDSVVRQLHAALAKTLAMPEVAARMQEQGAKPAVMPPDTFSEFRRTETDKWAKLIRAIGIKAD